ncbi:MAG: hypothetical protein HXY34_08115 [Candidatus Thorarchaeota archaeon]|nr:hypothetical protein [Candidatus Thorarchaeota archaeon]
MSISSLSEIPGVGEKLKAALIEHFGTEAVALKVILDSRVDLVSSVPGLGDKQAINIVKSAFEVQFGASANMILRSGDIRKIYDMTLEIIRGYANTAYARDKLFLYFPLPPSKLDVIMERQKYFADAMEMAMHLTDEQRAALRKDLSQIRALLRRTQPRRLQGRVVITNDDAVFDKLINEGVDKWCPVYVLSEGEKGADYSQGYDLVIYVSPSGFYDESMDALSNVEILGKEWKIDDIVPERTVSFYARNYRVIEAAGRLAELIKSVPTNASVETFVRGIDFNKISEVARIITNLNEEGEVAVGVDADLDRYRNATKTFTTAIAETEAWLNEEITTRISKSKVTLGGQQIISILQSMDLDGADSGALRNMLPPDIVEVFTNTIREAEDRLIKMLGLTPREAEWVTGLISEDLALPVTLVPQQINDLEDKLRRAYAEREFRLIRKFAGQLESLRQTVSDAVHTLLEFDLFLAVGLFGADYRLTTPVLSLDYTGVGVRGARNLFLVESMLKEKHGAVQPIDYAIGKTPVRPAGTNGENCAILSGANSGGKTTTIQTLAQVVTLAQAGFPVPAEEAHLRPFDEVYFFYKSRGMVSAGAFETTLKQFADIVTSDKAKLALFDEVEAITEPGSAANVIAGLLEILQSDPNSSTVICSHLAKEIKAVTHAPVRIDGIEARGLDENLELIVDRTPRFGHLARSTPELIVERLAKLAKGQKREVFERILEHLSQARSPTQRERS